jgi:hypothetical protein
VGVKRRTLLTACATATAAAVAGCGGSSGSDGSDGGDGGDGGNGGASIPGEIDNGVSGIEVTDHRSNPQSAGWAVEMTVENVGDQETNLNEYSYGVTPYDAEDTALSQGGGSASGTIRIEPGETATVYVYGPADVSESDVARYEVVIACFDGDGVYCG